MTSNEMNKHAEDMSKVAKHRGYQSTMIDYIKANYLNLLIDVIIWKESRIKGVLTDYLEFKKGEKILSVGSGAGTYEVKLAKLYDIEVWASDISYEWLKICKKRAIKNGVFNKMKFIHCPAENLLIKSNYFDKIVCSEVLEHIQNKNMAIKEMYRVLKKDGILALSTPNKINKELWRAIFFLPSKIFQIEKIQAYDQPVTARKLRELLTNNGFKIVDFQYTIFGPEQNAIWDKFPLHLQNILLKFCIQLEISPLQFLNAKLCVKAKKT